MSKKVSYPKIGQIESDGTAPQFHAALARVVQIITDGLSHGHFRCSISGSIGKDKRRELVIEAGRSHKFNIPEDELPS
jgi:hypothetical protein